MGEAPTIREPARARWAPPVGDTMRFFTYAHLPYHLQRVSQPFCDLAETLADDLPDGPQKVVALQRLLESKDAAVRTVVDR